MPSGRVCSRCGMRAEAPETCCLATSSRASPLHLWDALTGRLRASYRAFDDKDEITAAYSLAFCPGGEWLWAGYRGELRRFAVAVPGRECLHRKTKQQQGSGGDDGQAALHFACQNSNIEVAKLLLDRGVPVDSRKGKDGSTALQWAVNYSNLEMAEMFLQRGANQHHRDNDGDDITSYYIKQATNKEEMLALLARYA